MKILKLLGIEVQNDKRIVEKIERTVKINDRVYRERTVLNQSTYKKSNRKR